MEKAHSHGVTRKFLVTAFYMKSDILSFSYQLWCYFKGNVGIGTQELINICDWGL